MTAPAPWRRVPWRGVSLVLGGVRSGVAGALPPFGKLRDPVCPRVLDRARRIWYNTEIELRNEKSWSRPIKAPDTIGEARMAGSYGLFPCGWSTRHRIVGINASSLPNPVDPARKIPSSSVLRPRLKGHRLMHRRSLTFKRRICIVSRRTCGARGVFRVSVV